MIYQYFKHRDGSISRYLPGFKTKTLAIDFQRWLLTDEGDEFDKDISKYETPDKLENAFLI